MIRPDWVTTEQHWLNDCADVAQICKNYLSGDSTLIETSRELVRYAHRLRETNDPDFIFFIAVDSETDHLPVGKWREGWAADSLEKKDKEVKEIEAFYRSDAMSAAQSILNKFNTAEQGAAANP
jgi:hypothetical protein